MPFYKVELSLIKKLVEHERIIGRLYQTYSKKFDSEFWDIISGQEEVHAQWIESLYLNKNLDQVFTAEVMYSPESIISSIETIEKWIGQDNISEKDALKNALFLEESLLENNFLEIFHTTNSEMVKIFNSLRKETQEHASEIKNKLEEING